MYIGPRLRLIDTARDHHDLTERRLESGFDENQIFGAIVYSCVPKMQHSDPTVRVADRTMNVGSVIQAGQSQKQLNAGQVLSRISGV